jgi:hypothetical protein
MPDYRIDRQYITTALAHRHAAATADTQDALGQLATGLLRQLHTGANDPMAQLYRDQTQKSATDAEMDVLVNAVAGGERDLFVAVIPAQRLGLARTLVDDLIFGANRATKSSHVAAVRAQHLPVDPGAVGPADMSAGGPHTGLSGIRRSTTPSTS